MRLGRSSCGYIPKVNHNDGCHNQSSLNNSIQQHNNHHPVHFRGAEDVFAPKYCPILTNRGWGPRFVSMAGTGSAVGVAFAWVLRKLGFVARMVKK